MTGTFISVLLWVLAGGFIGIALAPLLGMIERWMTLGSLFALALGAAGWLVPALKGRIGIPIVTLAGALVGWTIGLVSNLWQVGALGIVVGAGAGAYWGTRLQERFTRNTNRGLSGSRDFYR